MVPRIGGQARELFIADRDPSIRAKLVGRAQEAPNVGGADPDIAALTEHHTIHIEDEGAWRQSVSRDDEHVGHVQIGVTRAGALESTEQLGCRCQCLRPSLTIAGTREHVAEIVAKVAVPA